MPPADNVSGFSVIRSAIAVLAAKSVDADAQIELAKVAKIVSRLELSDDQTANADLELIVGALEADPPNLILARELRYAIKMRTGAFRSARTARFMRLTGGSATTIVVTGLMAAVLSWAVIGFGLLWWFDVPKLRSLTFFPLDELTTIVFAAVLGAVVSIMVRLRTVPEPDDFSPGGVFLSAYFKPFIGVIIAMFAYGAVKGGVISSTLIPTADDRVALNGFHWVLGFLCGFSERFALGLVSRVEGKISGGERSTRKDDPS